MLAGDVRPEGGPDRRVARDGEKAGEVELVDPREPRQVIGRRPGYPVAHDRVPEPGIDAQGGRRQIDRVLANPREAGRDGCLGRRERDAHLRQVPPPGGDVDVASRVERRERLGQETEGLSRPGADHLGPHRSAPVGEAQARERQVGWQAGRHEVRAQDVDGPGSRGLHADPLSRHSGLAPPQCGVRPRPPVPPLGDGAPQREGPRLAARAAADRENVVSCRQRAPRCARRRAACGATPPGGQPSSGRAP